MSKLTLTHYYMYVGASYAHVGASDARQYPIRKTEEIGQSVKVESSTKREYTKKTGQSTKDEISKKREHDKKIKRAKTIFEIAVWSVVGIYILIKYMFF